jgi:hypothetical protein
VPTLARVTWAVVLGAAVAASTGEPAASSTVAAPQRMAVAHSAGEGTATVVVPYAATTATDGLPRVLGQGRHQLVLPVWQAPNAKRAATVELRVSGAQLQSCPSVVLRPGQVVRLRCILFIREGTGHVVLTMLSGDSRLGRWVHIRR